MNTSALLDTGSILNFVSHSLIERLGNPKPLTTWTGSLKTVNGLKPLSTPFYEVILCDVYNTYHAIRALKIPSIGHSNALNYSDFLAMMQALHVNPSLVQCPDGNPIHLLIGLDALDLLAHPVTSLPDIRAEHQKGSLPSTKFHKSSTFFNIIEQ